MRKALDLFAGCGGASLGFGAAGYDVLGVEYWGVAAKSHRLNGVPCLTADVRGLDPMDFDRFAHFHASPPCTTFSAAGRQDGRLHIDDLCEAVVRVMRGQPHGLGDIDNTTALMLEPARLLHQITPATISFEQVPAALPIWEAYAKELRFWGYSVWTANLSAECYGVPQSRNRAWLGASHFNDVHPPAPTHSKFNPRHPTESQHWLKPWATMSEAIGESEYTHYAPTGIGAKSNPARPRSVDQCPAPTVSGQMNHYLYVAADFPPGAQKIPEGRARRITVDEGAALQGFPKGFQLEGGLGQRRQMIGNSVPPAVAKAVVESLTP